MFKKVIIALAFAIALPVIASAQKFGVVDVQTIFTSLPESAAAEKQLAEASKKYEEEYTKLREEMDKKFKEFQALGEDAPASIKERRQEELQDFSRKMEQFRNTAAQDIERQQQTLVAPIEQKIKDAITAVGQEGGFTFIFQDRMGLYQGKDVVNITADVKSKLGVK